MVAVASPLLASGSPAPDFDLPGTDGKHWSLADCRGERGTLVMFICNHCPYVQAVLDRIISDAAELAGHGVGSVAIMPNDTGRYPEDGLAAMQDLSTRKAFPFPYLIDETQAVARAYGAVCTPDFFAFDASLKLRYRGRIDGGGPRAAPAGARRELFEAMCMIARTGQGPAEQHPSIGCSIKWREAAS